MRTGNTYKTFNQTNMSTKTQEYIETDVAIGLENTIIVFNDDVNTFDHVIESFVDVLDHTTVQAEQCAWIIHTKGKCKVKQGDYEELVPLCSAILDRGISAEIQ
jgi:ATP-dependent Clp protease adaptor protein ClpS